jgi:hypothetical protein
MPVDLAATMTELLKVPQGTQNLRPTQALALHDIGTVGGGVLPVGVGEGKTLISLLAPYVLDAKRPLLILPAGLIRKTNEDWKKYAKHWRIPNHIALESYEMLGRVQRADFLHVLKPDLLILDEAHRAKNWRAAVTRRIARFMHDFPDTKVVVMSGTLMRTSILNFAHLVQWALKDGAPLPVTRNELDEWAAALDEKVNELNRYEPGALFQLCPDLNDLSIEAARRGFRSRLVETPGVVATIGTGERVDCSIYINALKYDVEFQTDAHFKKLRDEWETPDGWELSQPVDVWRHAKELALGLYYAWSPRPPEDWRRARRDWHAFVREILSHSRSLDSELQVANACDAGKLDAGPLNAWRAIKDTFKPNTVAVWCDDSALRVCQKWMKSPGLVWTEHDLFARRLAQVTGCTYYGARGYSDKGEYIEHADGKTAIVVSLDANREGRNLQGNWSRNLITSCPEGSDALQQLIGRTHRPGQEADEVIVDILLGCGEHANAWRRALASALAVRDTTGADSKLLIADINWPDDETILTYAGSRWR